MRHAGGEDPLERATLLLVSRRAANELPRVVDPLAEGHREQERREAAEHDRRDPGRYVAREVVDLRADPEPRERLRAEQRKAQEHLHGEQCVREPLVGAPAPLGARLDVVAPVDGGRAGPSADEEPAGICRIVRGHGPDDPG